MTRYLLLAVLICATSLSAQDTLKLEDGKRLRGEILSEKDGVIRFVTRDAELVAIDSKLVVERKAGRPLPKQLLVLLDGKPEDLDNLHEAAKWAIGERRMKRHGERLYRRIVALDPGDFEAREALGHVKLGGTWYPDERTALREWGKVLAKEGYVKYRDGFAKKADVASIRKDERLWMLDEERRWRLVEELMAERGMIRWAGQWYHKTDDGLILGELEALKEAVGATAQAYRHFGQEVFLVGSRFEAEKLAKKLTDARLWVKRAFRIKDENYVLDPRAQFFVLRDRGQYRKFLTDYGKKHKRSADKVNYCMDLTGMSFGMHRVTDLQQQAWDHSLVSGLVALCVRKLAPEAAPIPAPIWVAAAMRAEEEVMGKVAVHFVQPSRYAQEESVKRSFKNLGEARKDLEEMRIRRKTRPLAELLRVDVNAMLPAHELQGYFFIGWLLEKKRAEFIAFCTEPAKGGERIEERFHRCLGAAMGEIEKDFWRWFERLPR